MNFTFADFFRASFLPLKYSFTFVLISFCVRLKKNTYSAANEFVIFFHLLISIDSRKEQSFDSESLNH